MKSLPPPEAGWAWFEDDAWRLCTRTFAVYRCRGGNPRRQCPELPIAEFQRGRGGWWKYCENHLFGRRLWNGKIWSLRRLP